jgi:hypothetical protein
MDQAQETPAPDMIRIDVRKEWEVRYWAQLFQVSDAEIRKAVKKVGVMSADVRRYFKAW